MKKNLPFRRGQIAELEISDLAFGGKGIARIETDSGWYVVFIPNTITGQQVRCRIVKAKKNYAEAKFIKLLKPSPLEVEHPYQAIAGAPYISLPIEKQLSYKKQSVIDLFQRIGKIAKADALFDEFISSPLHYHYRNKMEYSFSAVLALEGEKDFVDGFGLGFKKRGQWLAVEPLAGDSGIFDRDWENFLPSLSEHLKKAGHSAWHSRLHQGFCRMLAVKKSFAKDQLLINLVTSSSELDRFDQKAFVDLILAAFPDRIGGILHTVNDDPGDRPEANQGEQHLLYGQAFLVEKIAGLSFRISPESFFQTNPAAAEKLYDKALNYVFEKEIAPRSIVLDLFSGTGTISQLLAQRAKGNKIIGVEIVASAVEDAKRNAQLNGLDRLEFFNADVGKFLLERPEFKDHIDSVVLDPPRAGIAPKTLRKVISLSAKRIIYISCNPATQARDIQILVEAGYDLKKFSLVDQFPHTAHIESVALFEKREGSTKTAIDSVKKSTNI